MNLAEENNKQNYLFPLLLLFYAPKAGQGNSQEKSNSKSKPDLCTEGLTFSFLSLVEMSDILKLSHEASYFKRWKYKQITIRILLLEKAHNNLLSY